MMILPTVRPSELAALTGDVGTSPEHVRLSD
jgi:hypothetical protein